QTIGREESGRAAAAHGGGGLAFLGLCDPPPGIEGFLVGSCSARRRLEEEAPQARPHFGRRLMAGEPGHSGRYRSGHTLRFCRYSFRLKVFATASYCRLAIIWC